jgi:mRNA interferase MazF
MSIDRGDIVVALFPHSDLLHVSRRPALVVQDGDLGTGLAQVIVALITSNMARAGHPSRVTVAQNSPEGQQMGLRLDSVIMTDNLATIMETEIAHSIGSCSDMTAVDAALRHTLGLQ